MYRSGTQPPGCWVPLTPELLQPRCPDRRRRMTARSRTATRRSTPQTAASAPRTVELGEESLLEEVAHHANPAVARAKTTSAAVDRTVRRPRSLRAVRGSVPARRWRFGLWDCLSSLGSCGGIWDIELTSDLLMTGPGASAVPGWIDGAAGVRPDRFVKHRLSNHPCAAYRGEAESGKGRAQI